MTILNTFKRYKHGTHRKNDGLCRYTHPCNYQHICTDSTTERQFNRTYSIRKSHIKLLLILFAISVLFLNALPTTSAISNSLNSTEEMELIDIIIQTEDDTALLEKQGIHDAIILSIFFEMGKIINERSFMRILPLVRKDYPTNKEGAMRKEGWILPNTGKKELQREDYIQFKELRKNFEERQDTLQGITSFFAFMDQEIKKYNSSIILGEDSLESFRHAQELYTQHHYDEAYAGALLIKLDMDLYGVLELQKGYDCILNIKEGGHTTLLLHDIYESALDEMGVAYYNQLLNTTIVQNDPELLRFITSLNKEIIQQPGDLYVSIDYPSVSSIIQEINYTATQIQRIESTLQKVKTKIENYTLLGINTTGPRSLLLNAVVSFEEERYDEAETLVNIANSEIELESAQLAVTGVLARESVSIIKKHRYFFLSLLIFVVVLGPIILRRMRLSSVKKKIEDLTLEQTILLDLIKKTQVRRYQIGDIDHQTYEIKIDKYMDRQSKIKSVMPVLTDIQKRLEQLVFAERMYYKLRNCFKTQAKKR